MKKIQMVLLLIIAMALNGCTAASYENLIDAIKQTEQVNSGRKFLEIKNVTTLNEEMLSKEAIEKIKPYLMFHLKMTETFNKQRQLYRYDIYTTLGSLGFDSVVFVDKEEIIVEVPMIGKYLKFSKKDVASNASLSSIPITQTTLEEIQKLYLTTFDKDNVYIGEDAIMKTPDGDVKARKYSLDIDSQRWTAFMLSALDVLEKDEKLIAIMASNDLKGTVLTDHIRTFLKKIKYADVNINKYVDKDGYIVDEMLDMTLKLKGEDHNIKDQYFYYRETLGSINENLVLDKPIIKEEDIITFEQLELEFKNQYKQ